MQESKGMTHRTYIAAGWLALTLLVTTACTPIASAARGQQRSVAPPPATTAPAQPPESTVGNTAAELRRLMDAQQLTELRTTYNGNYGASLLFHADSLHYYVALFHDKEFWRVIRTDSVENAEQLYRTFADQTQQLAQVYIDTIRLEAGKRYTERMVSLNERRLQGMQQEIEQQRQQAMQVSASIEANKQQAVSLSSELRASNSQLEAINQRIQALQAQQVKPDLELPPVNTPPAPSPTPAAADTP
ncbi:DUF2968 domain-containing protein [[Pseudomonas] boreopolis]